jgi:integrase
LRFRVLMPDGRTARVSRPTGLPDSAHNRARVAPLAKAIGAAVNAGKMLADIDAIIQIIGGAAPAPPTPAPRVTAPAHAAPSQTVEGYYTYWISFQTSPPLRKSLVEDYQRHITGYVLPHIGQTLLTKFVATTIEGLRSELLVAGLSVKYVRNIVGASLRKMVKMARADGLIAGDPFEHITWPKSKPPDPDPFTPEERDRIIAWFRNRLWRIRDKNSGKYVRRIYLPYAAFVHLLFWSGLRPSEAGGLVWRHIDLQRRTLRVEQSRHLYELGEPKVESARRTVELFPETIRMLAATQPLHVKPDAPVFINLIGRPLEPQAFCCHWYDCLRALGIRQRGLYCTKDTFVTTALDLGVRIAWLEQQTGVSYATLRRHYGKWMPAQADSELRRFAEADPGLFGGKLAPDLSTVCGPIPLSRRKVVGNEMVPRGFEPVAFSRKTYTISAVG